ncbi:hypothetical protein SB659_10460 [Arthrobacter sp. SIMBA_036]|uniref:hypothetical protein n=1 Tax=Arthrobacter sp. SIMBA_036 TaxID=3085778 RepID=UPI00397C324A
MGTHLAPQPTQARYPWKTTIRTAFQVGIPAFVGLLVILPPILQDVVTTFGHQLPPGLTAWLAGAAVTITAASALLARISAMPGVIAWTRKYLPFLAPDNAKHRTNPNIRTRRAAPYWCGPSALRRPVCG